MKPYLFLITLFFCVSARATFSIIACQPDTGICGAAVATNNLAVGASVIHVQAKTGALASQFETHPLHGNRGLKLLSDKHSPDKALKILLQQDDNFDGGSISDRQIAIVTSSGDVVHYTGENAAASEWAGQMQSPYVSVQGNGLVGETVLSEMLDHFQNSSGTLPERLMSALEAGQSSGGQASGSMSAAILVRTPEGFPFDIDLRVDAHPRPVEQLRNLLDLHQARQLMIDARRLAKEQPEQARILLIKALEKGQSWDRILLRGIQVAEMLDDEVTTQELRGKLQLLNPVMFQQSE